LSFIQGYLSSMIVNGTELNLWSSAGELSKTTNAIPANTIGKTHNSYLNGKKDTAMTVTTHLDTASLTLLQAADDSAVPVVCTFRPGELGGKDAGSYTGDGIITELRIGAQVEDNWEADITIQGTEEWPYTQPA
jgi:hypothetical protein